MESYRKDYCLILFSVDEDLVDCVLRISETTPNILNYKSQDVKVITFASYFNINEITDFIKSYDINFLITAINKNTFGKNILDEQTDNDLFGFTYKSDSFINDIQETFGMCFENMISFNIEDLYEGDEIEEKINQILDKGIKHITDNDKKLIEKLLNK